MSYPNTLENVPKDVALGAGVYTRSILAVYDPLVVDFESRFVWKCPARQMVEFYNQHVTCQHLDVGVGNGYFLDRCRFPCDQPQIALLDLNPNSLETTSKRIRRYNPTVYRANVLEPIQLDLPRVDSIGMNYFLHCLPGTLLDKGAKVFSHLKPFLNPGGVLFGTTILGNEEQYGPLGRLFMYVYNSSLIPNSRVLQNQKDTVADLKAALEQHFSRYAVGQIGHVALFVGYN
jgi:ubiquinone/menaquinone biosynthesis C-methylase UbiE